MSNRILITGSKGTIGTALAKELQARGHEIFGCDLCHCQEEEEGSSSSPGYWRCDIADYRQLDQVMGWASPDYVYHCAAEFGRWNGEVFYEQLWRSNAVGTKNLIRLQEALRFRLIHFSSSEVYGDFNGTMAESVTDDHEIKLLNDYAMTKWVNEMQILNSISMEKTETVIVRLFNTYGPGEYYSPYRSVNCRFLYCALKGLPWIVHRGHTRTSTYISDTVRTLANIVDRFRPGEIYNIGGSQPHTIEELSDLVVKVTGADPILSTLHDPEPQTTIRKVPDISKAVHDLDHKNLVGLEVGLCLTDDWMKEVYHL